MKKPIIAITPQFDLDHSRVKIEPSYMKAVKEFGGIPILLPLYNDAKDLEQFISMVDGVIYSGGPDVNPCFFGESAIPECGAIMKERDILEIDLLPIIMKQQKPILGICRGIQVINIALGGDIYQDIIAQSGSKVGHSQKAAGRNTTHFVHIQKDTLLYSVLKKETIAVNSLHHQAVRKIAPGLIPAATAEDGIVEAVTMEAYPFFLGLQWHPEYLYEEDENARAIFKAFIGSCR